MRAMAVMLVCALLAKTGIGTVRAEDTRVEATLAERVGFDDNIGWTRDNSVSDLSSQTALGLNFSGSDEVIELDLKSRFLFTQFLDESGLDSNDQFIIGDAAYRTARSRTALTAEYIRDTSRTGQEDDTGQFLLDNIRQQEINIRPSWSFQATRLDRFTVAARYRQFDYERQLTDNERLAGSLSWARGLSEVSEITFAIEADQIDFDTVDDRRVRVLGAEVNWTAELSPRLRLTLGGGPYWADLSADPSGMEPAADDDSIGALANAGLSFKLDSETMLEASYRRFVASSGSGNAVIRDRVDASLEQNWSARVGWGVALRFQHQEAALGSGPADRDFFRVSPSVVWRLTEDWALRGAYRFRWQSVDGRDGDSVSNAAFVTLTYRPESWSLFQ